MKTRHPSLLYAFRLRRFVFSAALLFNFAAGAFAGNQTTILGGEEPASARRAFEEALHLRAEGDLVEAERLLAQAMHEFPGHPPYYFEMAGIYAARYDLFQTYNRTADARRMLERAASELERAVMLDPSFLAARFNLGITYRHLGEFEKARQELREAFRLAEAAGDGQTAANTLLQIGAAYEQQGFFDEARDTYMKAKESSYFDTGVQGALEDLKDNEEAYREYSQREAYASHLASYGGAFRYTPGSQAAAQENIRQETLGSGAAMQAIPYLGMMLAQQFLGRRGSGRAENLESSLME